MDTQDKGSRLAPNVAAALSYLIGWISGLVFFYADRQRDFVRFHAMQSILLFGGFTIACVILWALLRVPYLGILFMVLLSLLGLLGLVAWVILMVKAYRGERVKKAEKYSSGGMQRATVDSGSPQV